MAFLCFEAILKDLMHIFWKNYYAILEFMYELQAFMTLILYFDPIQTIFH